jgi:hypothetical protein
MSTQWQLKGGGQAALEQTDGVNVVVVATRAFPPGSTLEGEWAPDTQPYLVKVRGSRKVAGGFRVEGRLINLERAQRERLLGGGLEQQSVDCCDQTSN